MVLPDQFNFIRWLKDESVALVNDEAGKKLVVKECLHAPILENFSQSVKVYTRVLRNIMPELKNTGDFLYHTYVEGQMSGDTTNAFGMTKDAFAQINPLVLAQVLSELQNLSQADFLKGNTLEIRNSGWYMKNVEEARDAVTQEFDSNFFDSITQYLRKDGRNVDFNSKTLVNGDLHPQNLFINCLLGGEAKNFVIADWDLLHFNNPGYDMADLLVWGWRNPAWCDALISESKKLWTKDIDLMVFVNYGLVYLSCQMIKHVKIMISSDISEDAKINANGLLVSCKETLKRLVV